MTATLPPQAQPLPETEFFDRPQEPGVIQIGRVLTAEHGKGLGRCLMEEALRDLREKHLYLEAQVYAAGFYELFGFRVVSSHFEEDGIAHVCMRRD